MKYLIRAVKWVFGFKHSGCSHDCPFCGYHIVVCVSYSYLKCIGCTRRWKLQLESEL